MGSFLRRNWMWITLPAALTALGLAALAALGPQTPHLSRCFPF